MGTRAAYQINIKEIMMKDMLGRELHIGDKCLRISQSGLNRYIIEPAIVEEFTPKKVKIGYRTYLNSENLVILSPEGIDEFNRGTENYSQ